MRFDEAEKSIVICLVVTATDPKAKRSINHRYDPSPIFREGLFGFEPLLTKALPEKISQPLAPNIGIDELFLSVERWEPV